MQNRTRIARAPRQLACRCGGDPRCPSCSPSSHFREVAGPRGCPTPAEGSLESEACETPTGPVENPGHLIQTVQAPTRFLVLQTRPNVLPGGPDSAPIELPFFAGGGKLIGWRGTAVDFTLGAFAAGLLEQSTLAVSLTWNDGSDNLVTTGRAQTFAPFSDLFTDAQLYAPFEREVCSSDVLFVQFRNLQPAVGGRILVPSLTFAYKRNPILQG